MVPISPNQFVSACSAEYYPVYVELHVAFVSDWSRCYEAAAASRILPRNHQSYLWLYVTKVYDTSESFLLKVTIKRKHFKCVRGIASNWTLDSVDIFTIHWSPAEQLALASVQIIKNTIRYDTIEEFDVEYLCLVGVCRAGGLISVSRWLLQRADVRLSTLSTRGVMVSLWWGISLSWSETRLQSRPFTLPLDAWPRLRLTSANWVSECQFTVLTTYDF